MWLDEVLYKIGAALVTQMTKTVSLGTLADGTDSDAVVPLEQGIQAAINKFGNLSTDDVSYSSPIQAVNSGAVAPLMNKIVTYNTQKSPSGTSFSWDLTSDLQDLPNGYVVMRTRVIGNGSVLNNSTLLFDSDKSNEVYLVNNDRFPLSVALEVDIRTPNGDAKLTKNAYISAPESNQYTQTYTVVDSTNKVANATNLTELATMVQKQTDLHDSKISNIENIKVNGVSGSGLESILNNLKSTTDTQEKEIETLKEVEYDVDGNLKRGTTQEFIDSNSKQLSAIENSLSVLEDDVNSVKGQV
jgi:hypothetical protein